MHLFVGILILTLFVNNPLIFEFNKSSDIKDWKIVDDGVMGGKSAGSFSLSPDGYGVFEGAISLENNGGFSMVRYQFDKIKIDKSATIFIKLKGDGKKYQLRIKNNSDNYYSYIHTFETTGKWQEIAIPLEDMSPFFRGKKLDFPNFSHQYLEELAFLIGNKKIENFQLLIKKIEIN